MFKVLAQANNFVGADGTKVIGESSRLSAAAHYEEEE